MKKEGQLQLVIHQPQTEEGKLALARCAAMIQADWIISQISGLTGSAEEKRDLLDFVLSWLRLREGNKEKSTNPKE